VAAAVAVSAVAGAGAAARAQVVVARDPAVAPGRLRDRHRRLDPLKDRACRIDRLQGQAGAGQATCQTAGASTRVVASVAEAEVRLNCPHARAAGPWSVAAEGLVVLVAPVALVALVVSVAPAARAALAVLARDRGGPAASAVLAAWVALAARVALVGRAA
jgi:hypothetical protein